MSKSLLLSVCGNMSMNLFCVPISETRMQRYDKFIYPPNYLVIFLQKTSNFSNASLKIDLGQAKLIRKNSFPAGS